MEACKLLAEELVEEEEEEEAEVRIPLTAVATEGFKKKKVSDSSEPLHTNADMAVYLYVGEPAEDPALGTIGAGTMISVQREHMNGAPVKYETSFSGWWKDKMYELLPARRRNQLRADHDLPRDPEHWADYDAVGQPAGPARPQYFVPLPDHSRHEWLVLLTVGNKEADITELPNAVQKRLDKNKRQNVGVLINMVWKNPAYFPDDLDLVREHEAKGVASLKSALQVLQTLAESHAEGAERLRPVFVESLYHIEDVIITMQARIGYRLNSNDADRLTAAETVELRAAAQDMRVESMRARVEERIHARTLCGPASDRRNKLDAPLFPVTPRDVREALRNASARAPPARNAQEDRNDYQQLRPDGSVLAHWNGKSRRGAAASVLQRAWRRTRTEEKADDDYSPSTFGEPAAVSGDQPDYPDEKEARQVRKSTEYPWGCPIGDSRISGGNTSRTMLMSMAIQAHYRAKASNLCFSGQHSTMGLAMLAPAFFAEPVGKPENERTGWMLAACELRSTRIAASARLDRPLHDIRSADGLKDAIVHALAVCGVDDANHPELLPGQRMQALYEDDWHPVEIEQAGVYGTELFGEYKVRHRKGGGTTTWWTDLLRPVPGAKIMIPISLWSSCIGIEPQSTKKRVGHAISLTIDLHRRTVCLEDPSRPEPNLTSQHAHKQWEQQIGTIIDFLRPYLQTWLALDRKGDARRHMGSGLPAPYVFEGYCDTPGLSFCHGGTCSYIDQMGFLDAENRTNARHYALELVQVLKTWINLHFVHNDQAIFPESAGVAADNDEAQLLLNMFTTPGTKKRKGKKPIRWGGKDGGGKNKKGKKGKKNSAGGGSGAGRCKHCKRAGGHTKDCPRNKNKKG